MVSIPSSFKWDCRTGLTNHLKAHAADMLEFHDIVKDRKRPPTSEEIEIAEGQKTFASPEDFRTFLNGYKVANLRSEAAFALGAEKEELPFHIVSTIGS
jgi:hypothetical protein